VQKERLALSFTFHFGTLERDDHGIFFVDNLQAFRTLHSLTPSSRSDYLVERVIGQTILER
jgi:hypothetical protein